MSSISLPCPKCGRSVAVIDADLVREREPTRWPVIIMEGHAWQCRHCKHEVFVTEEKLRAVYLSAVSTGRRRIDWVRDFIPSN
ncbi:hypothetical protein BH18ACT6_BH18ACT6_07560 [soil metagenome]